MWRLPLVNISDYYYSMYENGFSSVIFVSCYYVQKLPFILDALTNGKLQLVNLKCCDVKANGV